MIGKAAKRVGAESRAQIPQTDWKRICGMRDVLIHDYIGVDLLRVWNVAAERIPELERTLREYPARDIAEHRG